MAVCSDRSSVWEDTVGLWIVAHRPVVASHSSAAIPGRHDDPATRQTVASSFVEAHHLARSGYICSKVSILLHYWQSHFHTIESAIKLRNLMH